MNKTIVLLASALPEELEATHNYLASNAAVDHVLCAELENLAGNCDFELVVNAQGNTSAAHKWSGWQPCIASAFVVSVGLSCLLLNTGYGSAAVKSVFSTLLASIAPRYIYYTGSALAISKHLQKGDYVQILDVVSYDCGSYAQSTPHSISLTPVSALHNTLRPNAVLSTTEVSNAHLGIALSSNSFVNVVGQKKARQLQSGQELAILPLAAQEAVRQLECAYAINLVQQATACSLVLDMESAAVVQAVKMAVEISLAQASKSATAHKAENLASSYPKLGILRVVLDSIYDNKKINYRKDSKLLSHRIAKYMLPLLLAHQQESC